MTPFWKIAVSVTCLAAICGAAIFWREYKEKANSRNLAQVATVCRARAEQGDPGAQSNLAFLYSHGQGVPRDDDEAVRWYRKAADQGYAMAQNGLAIMYHQGRGGAQDDAEAVRWFRKAADQGYAKAQYGLGFMYDNGRGVPKDHAEAVRWFRKAADQGDENAKYALGLMGMGLNAGRKARYLFLSIVFLGSLVLLIASFLRRKRCRDWRQRAISLLVGILGISYAGLSLYGYAHHDMRDSVCANAFYLAKGLLIGMLIILVVLIWITGKKHQRKQEMQ